jgi:hypothetical protein
MEGQGQGGGWFFRFRYGPDYILQFFRYSIGCPSNRIACILWLHAYALFESDQNVRTDMDPGPGVGAIT